MKLLYATGNRLGAGQALAALWLANPQLDMRVAGYQNLSDAVCQFDWTLDPIEKYPHLLDQITEDVLAWEPNMAIVDAEPIIASIAHKHDIPIVKCSSLHLLDGVKWKRGQQKYTTTLESTRILLSKLPPAVASLVYAPYGFTGAELKPGFEWIEPYVTEVKGSLSSKISLAAILDSSRIELLQNLWTAVVDEFHCKNWHNYPENLQKAKSILCSGETSLIADALIYGKELRLIPNVKDPENVLNALMCSVYKLGEDLGQIELLGRLAIADLQKSFEHSFKAQVQYEPVGKLLHERIEEIWESL